MTLVPEIYRSRRESERRRSQLENQGPERKTWAADERNGGRDGEEEEGERTLSLVGEEVINLGGGSVVSNNLEAPGRTKARGGKVSEKRRDGRLKKEERGRELTCRSGERWDGKGVGGRSESLQHQKPIHLSTCFSLY